MDKIKVFTLIFTILLTAITAGCNELTEKDNIHSKTSNAIEETNDVEEDALSAYSAEEIEYAKVWLETVGNKNIQVLNVIHISEGESVSSYEDKTVKYPEDVIYLSTNVLADGNVTYSNNSDGSITEYDIPARWPTPDDLKLHYNQTPKEYNQSLIDDTEKVLITPRDDEEVIEIINKLEIIDK